MVTAEFNCRFHHGFSIGEGLVTTWLRQVEVLVTPWLRVWYGKRGTLSSLVTSEKDVALVRSGILFVRTHDRSEACLYDGIMYLYV